MLASATVVCLNTSRHRLYKFFHSTGMPKLTTGYGTNLLIFTVLGGHLQNLMFLQKQGNH